MYPAPAYTNLHRANRDASQKCCSIKGTKRRCGEDTVESRDMLGLGRPLDRRVVQSPFDHFVLQPIGILTNCWVRHELIQLAAQPAGSRRWANVFDRTSMLMVWTLWNASGADAAGLKREGASVVCPELGKRFPWAAQAATDQAVRFFVLMQVKIA